VWCAMQRVKSDQNVRRHVPEDGYLRTHSPKNVKSHNDLQTKLVITSLKGLN